MKCYDFRELQIFVEYDHSRESIIVGRSTVILSTVILDISGYSRRCLKIVRTHLGGWGAAIIRGRRLFGGPATIRVYTVCIFSHLLLLNCITRYY